MPGSQLPTPLRQILKHDNEKELFSSGGVNKLREDLESELNWDITTCVNKKGGFSIKLKNRDQSPKPRIAPNKFSVNLCPVRKQQDCSAEPGDAPDITAGLAGTGRVVDLSDPALDVDLERPSHTPLSPSPRSPSRKKPKGLGTYDVDEARLQAAENRKVISEVVAGSITLDNQDSNNQPADPEVSRESEGDAVEDIKGEKDDTENQRDMQQTARLPTNSPSADPISVNSTQSRLTSRPSRAASSQNRAAARSRSPGGRTLLQEQYTLVTVIVGETSKLAELAKEIRKISEDKKLSIRYSSANNLTPNVE